MPRKKKESGDTPAPPAAEGAAMLSGAEADPGDGAAPRIEDPARVLTFRLDEQLYGLPIDSVQEIQQLVELMPLPDAAPALVGMLDVRGLVVPAIDLRTLVGIVRREYTLETPMVFCRAHGRVVCLIVDVVEDVVEVPPGSIQPPSNLYGLADRMLGVCHLEQGLVMILDPERLIPDAALHVVDAVTEVRP